ncbi:MAG: hypothetical protein GXO92_07075, partial [FCB group bacterium]|nr:hypothetical protein [FCB group bacterium]
MFSPKLKLMRLIVITTILFIIWGCPGPVPPPEEGIPLEDFRFSYLQEQNELYFAVQVEPSYQGNRLDSVRVAWYGTDPAVVADTIALNDSGRVGDIIAFDDVYARKVKNDTAFINNVVSMADTGLVYIDYLAYYKSLVVTETDSFFLGNIR